MRSAFGAIALGPATDAGSDMGVKTPLIIQSSLFDMTPSILAFSGAEAGMVSNAAATRKRVADNPATLHIVVRLLGSRLSSDKKSEPLPSSSMS